MSLSDDLKLKLEQQKAARISKEAHVDKLLHTIYLGDRTIQQLGQKPIANGIKLNNAAVEIGDPMLPLAKGDVLRRVDNKNRNGGKALGSAQRTALERDGLANKRSNGLGDNGDIAPTNNPNDGAPKKPPKGFDPPFGCEPPVQNCVWLNTAIAPDGYGSHGSVVLNNDGLELFLYCALGTTPPPDLGCDFNRDTVVKKWGISGTYSATFTGSPPNSYQANFFVLSTTQPILISTSIFNPNTSYPNIIYGFPGADSSACSTSPAAPISPDGNQWLIATIQTSSQLFGVLIGGAIQSLPFISASWSGGGFTLCP